MTQEAHATDEVREVWVFTGAGARFPAGVFSTLDNAETWIAKHQLSGTVTQYILDQGAYEHSIENGSFTPNQRHQCQPDFIGRFSGGERHHHYEHGLRES